MHGQVHTALEIQAHSERLLLNHKRHQDSWPPEEKNSIQGQRQGLIDQSFCVIKFYWSIKEIEKASDIDIRRSEVKWSRSVVSNSLDPMDCSLTGSSIHGIFQAKILEWVAISFSRGSSQPRNRTQVYCIVGRCFYRLSHQGSPDIRRGQKEYPTAGL